MDTDQSKPVVAVKRRGFERRRVALLFYSGTVLSAAVLAGLLMQLRADAIASAHKLLTAVAQLTDEQTSRTLQNVEQALSNADAILSAAALSAAFPPSLTGGVSVDAGSIDEALHKLVEERPYITVMRVLDANGRALYASDTGNSGIDLSDRAYFSNRRDGRETAFKFDLPIRNRVADKWVIPAARTVRTVDGEFAGVVVAAIDPLFFNRVWALDEEIPKLSMTLFRGDGVMLMRSPLDEKLIGTSYSSSYVFDRVRAGVRAGTFQNRSSVDGDMRLFAFRQLTAYPLLVLVVGQAVDQALAPWWRIVWIVVAGWSVAVLVVGGLTLWLRREWRARQDTQIRYRTLFDANPYPMVVMDPQTRGFLDVNDAAIQEYGWSREESHSITANDLYSPDDLKAVAALRQADPSGAAKVIKGLRHRRKDGTFFDVEMHTRRIELDGKPAVLTMAQNVSERHAAEAQLRQAQKMEAVGQLTGGIAHDFNNILMVILASADALQEEEASLDAATIAERLEQISQAVLRASELTRQLLAFSRKAPLNPRRTDLNELVTGTGKLLRRALGENILIDAKLAADLWSVSVDRAQLETALVNLCVNARDAMPGGGKLTIETRNVRLDRDNVTQAMDVAPGDYAMIAVADTGSGMSEATRAKVFEPFFTTKEIGKGTGLGLSMVYGFIKQSQGHITIHSELGRGTTFRLYLPRSDGQQEAADIESTVPIARGNERILVVEDEPQVRTSVVQQLRSLGYSVIEMPDGAAGLAAFEAATVPFDLLLTDLVMPGAPGGRALAAAVAVRWPTTAIVLMSGYAKNAGSAADAPAAGAVLLSKPFRKRELAQTVRQALDEAARSTEMAARRP